MTATLDTPAPTTTTEHTLCYCTNGVHRPDDRESTWRYDIEAVRNDQTYYSPDAHIVRRVSHVEAVTP